MQGTPREGILDRKNRPGRYDRAGSQGVPRAWITYWGMECPGTADGIATLAHEWSDGSCCVTFNSIDIVLREGSNLINFYSFYLARLR